MLGNKLVTPSDSPRQQDFPSLQSDIPLGCGFGSSAALCVALLRAAHEAGTTMTEQDLIAQATTLEALFSRSFERVGPCGGRSSNPLRFHMGQPPQAWRWRLQGVGSSSRSAKSNDKLRSPSSA
ncbi:MAG: hypothetical protein H6728_15630 [Myxococcales bacterium]|nr:hypothetical protein [Myxococcales bacterium]